MLIGCSHAAAFYYIQIPAASYFVAVV